MSQNPFIYKNSYSFFVSAVYHDNLMNTKLSIGFLGIIKVSVK